MKPEPPPLVEGTDVVLCGIVRHFEAHEVAVKVSITQAGSESESSGSWSHAWTEIDREIILAPFLLELPNKQLVLVEPPKNVDVADALDQKVWIDRNKRVLSAELLPGEQIFARGRLERSDRAVATPSTGAYRDVEWGWALRPIDRQMLLSSEPLGAGLRKRADFHRGAAWTAVAIIVTAMMTLLPFFTRLAGHTETRTVISANESESTDSDGDTTVDYDVDIEGRSIGVSGADYSRVSAGSIVPVRVGATGWDLGAVATIHLLHCLALVVTASIFWSWYGLRRRSTRPWFRRKVHEANTGRLPDHG